MYYHRILWYYFGFVSIFQVHLKMLAVISQLKYGINVVNEVSSTLKKKKFI